MDELRQRVREWESARPVPVPVEWFSHETFKGESDESMQSCAAVWQASLSRLPLHVLRRQRRHGYAAEPCITAELGLQFDRYLHLLRPALELGNPDLPSSLANVQ